MTAWALLLCLAIAGPVSLAMAGTVPSNPPVDQLAASAEQSSTNIRLAQAAPAPGKMLGGAGLFGPGVSEIPTPTGSAPPVYVPEVPCYVPDVAPVTVYPYTRCPYGGFDCYLE
jgi:hypothetical protein